MLAPELPFQAQRPCPKCGMMGAKVQFCGVGTIYRRYCDEYGPHPEHMRRTCPCCGYSWDEAPLDSQAGNSPKVP